MALKVGASLGVMHAFIKHNEGDHPTGLKNLGNTCFLNSIIQAVASCPPFLSYLKIINDKVSRLKKDSLLTPPLLKCIFGNPKFHEGTNVIKIDCEIFVDVRRKQSESVNSREVLRVLTSKNNSFAGHEQQVSSTSSICYQLNSSICIPNH